MKKSILLKDLVEKLGFEIVYKSDDYDKIEIDINEVAFLILFHIKEFK